MLKMLYTSLTSGDPAPWFTQRCTSNERYGFSSVAGRYVVLCFLGSASTKEWTVAAGFINKDRELFDDRKMCLFGVSVDPSDLSKSRLRETLPGIRHFWDFDLSVSKLYGAVAKNLPANQKQISTRNFWLVLDPNLRVLRDFPFSKQGHQNLFDYLNKLPAVDEYAGFEVAAPVLVIPRVFEPEFCRDLIKMYETSGGEESGFMQEENGMTVLAYDSGHKKRRDHVITDEQITKFIQAKIVRRVNPEMKKAYCYTPTRMERYIVSCYSAEDGGHFRAHRDNTTKGTAHRRFAVSINLNDDFDGGELTFPEYGSRRFRAPLGGAVVFSGSLLHEVSKVTRGKRFAFLPFVYDDEAARLREENAKFLTGSASEYKVSQ